MKRKDRNRSGWWTGNIRSLNIGERLRLVPYWEIFRTDPDRINVIVDPGPAFGAGDHPSTVMALELLEAAVKQLNADAVHRPSMLDVGTGTGVLAIAGKLIGVGFAVGFDIDSPTIYTARRNLELNRMSGATASDEPDIELFVGELDCVKRSFHIVAANLAAPLLKELAASLASVTKSHLILSGIADEMKDVVIETYLSGSFSEVRRLNRKNWNAFLLRKISGQ